MAQCLSLKKMLCWGCLCEEFCARLWTFSSSQRSGIDLSAVFRCRVPDYRCLAFGQFCCFHKSDFPCPSHLPPHAQQKQEPPGPGSLPLWKIVFSPTVFYPETTGAGGVRHLDSGCNLSNIRGCVLLMCYQRQARESRWEVVTQWWSVCSHESGSWVPSPASQTK